MKELKRAITLVISCVLVVALMFTLGGCKEQQSKQDNAPEAVTAHKATILAAVIAQCIAHCKTIVCHFSLPHFIKFSRCAPPLLGCGFLSRYRRKLKVMKLEELHRLLGT